MAKRKDVSELVCVPGLRAEIAKRAHSPDSNLTLADLTADPRNARKHTQRGSGLVVAAIRDVGFARSIVIDEDGRILCGNQAVECAGEVGIERVKVVEADGNEVVAVRRRGLSEEQKTRLALYDNRSSDSAMVEWDSAVLKELADDELDLEALGFDDDELSEIGVEDGAAVTPPSGFPEVDESVETEHQCPKCGYRWSGKSDAGE